ncbi:S-formylglutathione hydrolase [Pseudoalteromonas sp. SWXJZ94C]|uniref:S-formylglutathione hydrolase n=1 Tax=unclassified Pseudoalteromonas TaxID=194690 RepID=UPI00041FA8CE|nr:MULTISPECIES: S-formylglutathione hydrolase [unclassified Pseudoalteromonas]MBH0056033.1 S-formylglutathione hydrolase [Pseudoalteromonas sp. SWXJZ94C]
MLENISSVKVAGGWHKQYTHSAQSTHCTMRFAVFLPPGASEANKVPVLYWLSGLTCTDENFMQKAGAFKKAAELGIAIVAPDTSPRGENVPNEDTYDFAQGAGFYVNATQAPYNTHFNMYDYVVNELPALIEQHFPVTSTKAISGHSMGGHGALMVALKNPTTFVSASAFSPIVNPIECPWGVKAFTGYLGNDKALWTQYDSCELMKNAEPTNYLPMLVSQGDADNFLEEQLKPQNLIAVANQKNYPLTLEMQAGYDHSYFFISSFIDQHLLFHHQFLSA